VSDLRRSGRKMPIKFASGGATAIALLDIFAFLVDVCFAEPLAAADGRGVVSNTSVKSKL